MSAPKTYTSVQEYYGKVLGSTKDLRTSACTAAGRPHPELLRLIQQVPDEINDKFYGCGAPIPLGIEGLRVLDLGSGSGRDCYVAAALVGSKGAVTGLDMTPEQLQVSRRHVDKFCCETLGYAEPNMKFVQANPPPPFPSPLSPPPPTITRILMPNCTCIPLCD